MQRSLILITGGEGAGKTTIMSALLPHTPRGAKIDAEDVGQVNPFTFNRLFLELLWNNVTAVITNFWAAGYPTVIAGSLLEEDTYASFRQFQRRLPKDVAVYVIHLRATKTVRDQRRIDRAKRSTEDWRDRVDALYPRNDTSLRDNASEFRYIYIDNTGQDVAETVAAIKTSVPEIYNAAAT